MIQIVLKRQYGKSALHLLTESSFRPSRPVVDKRITQVSTSVGVLLTSAVAIAVTFIVILVPRWAPEWVQPIPLCRLLIFMWIAWLAFQPRCGRLLHASRAPG